MPSLDEMLGSLESLKELTDEQLLEKYKDCFNFESEYLARVKAGKVGEEDDETSDQEIAQAKKRILEKKKTKKQQAEEELKKLLLDDADLLK